MKRNRSERYYENRRFYPDGERSIYDNGTEMIGRKSLDTRTYDRSCEMLDDGDDDGDDAAWVNAVAYRSDDEE